MGAGASCSWLDAGCVQRIGKLDKRKPRKRDSKTAFLDVRIGKERELACEDPVESGQKVKDVRRQNDHSGPCMQYDSTSPVDIAHFRSLSLLSFVL